ncbi:hypothetical protein Val02_92280 [Virgisporangium aliadipatigenens]|uniref:Uncharacterized protein n=1 Tax=Virgisporangium aliadipatigenens TaxID=741659 RepID=A0A8J3YXG6_9ACTN|nr:hypothetical protein [Virgisporangium aliadipatigenens]GIJ52342.1 hypothetical protein Val02_92280 [Virgisporangium aliadipatigenens]
MPAPQRGSYIDLLVSPADKDNLLEVVDALIYFHPAWQWPPYLATFKAFEGELRALDVLLVDAGSLYRVDMVGRGLARRVDETVQKASSEAVASAKGLAADHLARAWHAAYGVGADPDKAISEAIKAIEEVACPLVEPTKASSNKATLGTAIGELKNSGHKWEILLPDLSGSPRSVDSIVAMMETLWQAQVSRHGGAPKSRPQTREEAEAAVNLAVLLFQWLSTDVLRRKP